MLSRGGCGYNKKTSVKPAVLAGHFIWDEYDWMLSNAQVRAVWAVHGQSRETFMVISITRVCGVDDCFSLHLRVER